MKNTNTTVKVILVSGLLLSANAFAGGGKTGDPETTSQVPVLTTTTTTTVSTSSTDGFWKSLFSSLSL
ncbi:hypothetical protein KIH87_08965 [Paraneptunicella aestuarii]|uniref:hypothetical protein n=1 Tax=Paraneptunicella aestuarii TaxID=2831148 RepID=UPI001E42F490|nr:hypothetical protein [Paraneptunicella aestuarii]UAA40445.1 hypothetical protein KIH87_08965 [Paraneptunicella aestuarii]